MTAQQTMELAGLLKLDVGAAIALGVYVEAEGAREPGPTINELASLAGVKWDTARRWVDVLVERGLIVERKTSARRSDLTVVLDKLPAWATGGDHPESGERGGGDYPENGERGGGDYPENGEPAREDHPENGESPRQAVPESRESSPSITRKTGNAIRSTSGSPKWRSVYIHPDHDRDRIERVLQRIDTARRDQPDALDAESVFRAAVFTLAQWGRVHVKMRGDHTTIGGRYAAPQIDALVEGLGGYAAVVDLIRDHLSDAEYPGDKGNVSIVLSASGLTALYNRARKGSTRRRPPRPTGGLTFEDMRRHKVDGADLESDNTDADDVGERGRQ